MGCVDNEPKKITSRQSLKRWDSIKKISIQISSNVVLTILTRRHFYRTVWAQIPVRNMRCTTAYFMLIFAYIIKERERGSRKGEVGGNKERERERKWERRSDYAWEREKERAYVCLYMCVCTRVCVCVCGERESRRDKGKGKTAQKSTLLIKPFTAIDYMYTAQNINSLRLKGCNHMWRVEWHLTDMII